MSDAFRYANEALNEMLVAGRAMDAFEKFYAQNVVMQENSDEPRRGKDINRSECGDFYDNHPDLSMKIMSVAYGDRLSMQEIEFHYTEDGVSIKYSEVAIRRWEDLMVVHERFIYDSGS